MPVVVYRQPWFWAVIAAFVAIFVFGIVIFASSPDRDENATTIVQQPAPEPEPQITPVPMPQPTQPTQPITPPPAPDPGPAVTPPPAEPEPPQVIRERTVIIREGNGQKPNAQKPSGQGETRRPRESRPPQPPQESGAQDVFRNTGLPREVGFDGQTWKAQEVRTLPQGATSLQSLGLADDGTELFARQEATEPFSELFALVPGETDRYVRYSR